MIYSLPFHGIHYYNIRTYLKSCFGLRPMQPFQHCPDCIIVNWVGIVSCKDSIFALCRVYQILGPKCQRKSIAYLHVPWMQYDTTVCTVCTTWCKHTTHCTKVHTSTLAFSVANWQCVTLQYIYWKANEPMCES